MPRLTFDEFAAPNVDLRLRVTVAPDGSAQVRGRINLRSSSLIPRESESGARATCDDLDGDGRSGLVRLAADFRDTASGERVRVMLTPRAHDIAASGVYTIELQINESGMIGDIRTVISGQAA